MGHPIWPFFDLRVTTPRLELVPIDDDVATQLALLAAKGVHDPSFMPFTIPWTDVASPQFERNCMQHYWRNRVEMTPAAWSLNLAVAVDGELVGTTGFVTTNFDVNRVFETGSWLGIAHHGKGIGKEMRLATLHLGFLGFGGRAATTSAWHDNGPSLGVTRSLGYRENGQAYGVRRGQSDRLLRFEMTREDFESRLRRDDIEVHGAEPCLPLLGLDRPEPRVQADGQPA